MTRYLMCTLFVDQHRSMDSDLGNNTPLTTFSFMLCRSCCSLRTALWEFQQQNTGKFRIPSLYRVSQLIGFRMQVDL